jgi:hypothetical protein
MVIENTPHNCNPGQSGNGGRPRGSNGRHKASLAPIAEKVVARVRDRDAARAARKEGSTPLEFLLNVMNDVKAAMADRIEAAKAAMPYIHKRQPMAVEVEQKVPLKSVTVIIAGVRENGETFPIPGMNPGLEEELPTRRIENTNRPIDE